MRFSVLEQRELGFVGIYLTMFLIFSEMNNICFYNKKVVLKKLNLIKGKAIIKNGRSQ